jgi:tryptophan synthase alpha chain
LKGGVTTDRIFEMVKELRRNVTVPMVFMTYANVVYSYGIERFCDRCVETGIDGMILPDVPFEEKEEFAPDCRARGLSFISLIAPTSAHRVAMIAQEAEGFLYIVSSMGVTGVRSEITTDIGGMVKLVRQNASIPCAVGFGISTPTQAKKMAGLSDGAIVGSAIVRLIAEHGKNSPQYVYEYVKSMKEGMRA